MLAKDMSKLIFLQFTFLLIISLKFTPLHLFGTGISICEFHSSISVSFPGPCSYFYSQPINIIQVLFSTSHFAPSIFLPKLAHWYFLCPQTLAWLSLQIELPNQYSQPRSLHIANCLSGSSSQKPSKGT